MTEFNATTTAADMEMREIVTWKRHDENTD